MRTMDYDYCVIESYNIGTGEVVCTEKLEGYHYGASDRHIESDDYDFNMDMRAEVVLLSRNIKITASTYDIGHILNEPWGCRILISDFFEPTLVYRKGSLEMDHVEVYNCSQKSTYKAAIKWH
jgi:hypothetical protein